MKTVEVLHLTDRTLIIQPPEITTSQKDDEVTLTLTTEVETHEYL